jgi:hypothetical protein
MKDEIIEDKSEDDSIEYEYDWEDVQRNENQIEAEAQIK